MKNQKFEYRPGVLYRVFHDDTQVLETSDAGRLPITRAVRAGVAKLLRGKISRIYIRGDDGSQVSLAMVLAGRF